MKTVMKLFVLVLVTAALSFAVAGCKSHDKHHGDHPKGEHANGDHPKGDHPKADHPKGDHPSGDHPK